MTTNLLRSSATKFNTRLFIIITACALVASIFGVTAFMQNPKPQDKAPVVDTDPNAVEAKDVEEYAPIVNEPAPAEINTPLAGLTGTKNIPGDYATLALAI